MRNTYVKSKLIKFYVNKKYIYFRTKSLSTTITDELLGKYVFVYNGKKWICKDIDNDFYVNKPIGELKNINTKISSIYKKKKLKKKK